MNAMEAVGLLWISRHFVLPWGTALACAWAARYCELPYGELSRFVLVFVSGWMAKSGLVELVKTVEWFKERG